VNWDDTAIHRWLEPLAGRGGEIAEVFGETLTELALEWRDGALGEARVRREEGTSARRRAGGTEQFVFVPGAGDAAVREAVRALRAQTGSEPLPIRSARPADAGAAEAFSDGERWARRLSAILSRHAPRHAFSFRLRETERRVVADGRRTSLAVRRLVSLEGRFTAASRAGDEERPFAFHAPASEGFADELKAQLCAAAAPRDRAVPAPAGETDVILSGGCAAVFFHEVLGHPLEADAEASPLRGLPDARVTVSDLDVSDDPRRLDLFGGYEHDDEGTAPRSVRLVASGLLGSRLTDRAHAPAAGSTGHGRRAGPSDPPLPRGSNVVVAAGSADADEMLRRLGNGLWIEEFAGGSVEIASGSFRLRFPRARRVRRGRLADELSGGVLAGELLPALGAIEPALGREVRACRSFGWCARGGQVVPVGGAAPEVLLRRLMVRPAP
jgi:predicted Zn-dependent protease